MARKKAQKRVGPRRPMRPANLLKTTAVIKRNKKGEYYFTVQARNGQTISVGEGYTRKAGAIRGAYRAFPFVHVVRDLTGEKKAA